MKSLVSTFLLLGISTSSFANCINSFEDAAFKREKRNQGLVVAGVVAAVVTAAVLTDGDRDNSSSRNSSRESDYQRRERLRRQNFNRYHYNHYRSHHVRTHYHVRSSYYTHRYYGHESYHRHYHRSYGYYYVESAPADDRWLGDNNFDKVLKAYNDSIVAFNTDVVRTSSPELNRLNELIVKRVIRVAKKAKQLDKVRDIKRDKRLTLDRDLEVVRDALIAGMEDTTSTGFCPSQKALKRKNVIDELAKKLLASRI